MLFILQVRPFSHYFVVIIIDVILMTPPLEPLMTPPLELLMTPPLEPLMAPPLEPLMTPPLEPDMTSPLEPPDNEILSTALEPPFSLSFCPWQKNRKIAKGKNRGKQRFERGRQNIILGWLLTPRSTFRRAGRRLYPAVDRGSGARDTF